jgi:hypothetical protein
MNCVLCQKKMTRDPFDYYYKCRTEIGSFVKSIPVPSHPHYMRNEEGTNEYIYFDRYQIMSFDYNPYVSCP